MHLLFLKNLTNNTLYTVQELHAFLFNGIPFNGISFNEIASNEIAFNGIASKVSL